MAAKTKLIVNLTRGECLCVGVLADRPLRRMRGLIGQEALAAGEGMLVTPAPAIHTAFMRFPIDAVFLDRSLRVLDIVERLKPWRMASRHRARAVLELAAGECARRRVEVGDRLGLCDRRPLDPVHDDGDVPASLPQVPSTTAHEPSESIIWPASVAQPGEVARPQPLRVLVISGDRHFRSVISMLLSHRGCSVSATATASKVSELVEGDRADVVLIDAGQVASSAQVVAAAASLEHPVGVVLVDDAPSRSESTPVLAKWGPFDDLFAAIEAAEERAVTWRNNVGGC